MIINGFPISGGTSGIDISTATVTLVSSSLTYDGRPKTKQVQSVVLGGNTLVAGTDYVVNGNSQVNAGTHLLTVVGVGDYSGSVSASWSIEKATGTVTLSENSIELDNIGETATIEVTSNSGGTVSAVSSDTGVATVSVSGNIVTVASVSEGTATITVTVSDTANYTSASATCLCECVYIHIYGVVWDKTSTTVLTRTDKAAFFSNPSPAIGTGSGSSPFDTRMPWSGMVKVVSGNDTFVRIPKFWYKITDDGNGLKIQIADAEVSGFSVSPGHADRGDGSGERDYIYVGRYHCDSNYQSKAGSMPKYNITRSDARSGIHNRSSKYWQLDYATLWTIRMLYLVEFADWDAQKVIGYGCGNGEYRSYMGYTDSMTYHTGTTQTSRYSYGGTQYRWIEGLWDNVYDWVDGIVMYYGHPCICTNPAKFGDSTTNHTYLASVTSGNLNDCIKSWTVPSESGFDWALYPKTTVVTGDCATYVADRVYSYAYSSEVVVFVGGTYGQSRGNGLFCTKVDATSYYGNIGARLQYLP